MTKENIPINLKKIRPNFKIISSLTEPVYTFVCANNPGQPLITETLAQVYAKKGRYFSVNTGAQLAGTSNYLYCQFELPANWSKTMYVDRLRAGSINSSTVNVYSLGTSSLGVTLTAISPLNVNFTSTNTSEVSAGYTVSTTNITSGTLIYSAIQAAGTEDIDISGRVIVGNPTTSKQYFYVKLINAANASCIVNCSWWEV